MITPAHIVAAFAIGARVLADCPRLLAYIERMYARPKAAMRIAAAFASLGI